MADGHGEIDPSRLVFLDETSTPTTLTPLRARAPRGQRAVGRIPRGRREAISWLATSPRRASARVCWCVARSTGSSSRRSWSGSWCPACGQARSWSWTTSTCTRALAPRAPDRGRRLPPRLLAHLLAGLQPDRARLRQDEAGAASCRGPFLGDHRRGGRGGADDHHPGRCARLLCRCRLSDRCAVVMHAALGRRDPYGTPGPCPRDSANSIGKKTRLWLVDCSRHATCTVTG